MLKINNVEVENVIFNGITPERVIFKQGSVETEVWTNSRMVTFIYYNGSTHDTKTIKAKYNSTINDTVSANGISTTLTGAVFKGWSTNTDESGVIDGNTRITSDMTLRSVFTYSDIVIKPSATSVGKGSKDVTAWVTNGENLGDMYSNIDFEHFGGIYIPILNPSKYVECVDTFNGTIGSMWLDMNITDGVNKVIVKESNNIRGNISVTVSPKDSYEFIFGQTDGVGNVYLTWESIGGKIMGYCHIDYLQDATLRGRTITG